MLNSPLLIEGRTIRNLLGESSSLAIRCHLGLFSMRPFICLGLDAKTTFHLIKSTSSFYPLSSILMRIQILHTGFHIFLLVIPVRICLFYLRWSFPLFLQPVWLILHPGYILGDIQVPSLKHVHKTQGTKGQLCCIFVSFNQYLFGKYISTQSNK